MGKVNDPDILVIIADFFFKMAEVTWSIVAGVYGQRLIIIFRNAGFRLDAGKIAQKLFSENGSAGGHKTAARAEIPIHELGLKTDNLEGFKNYVLNKIKLM